MSNSSNLKFFRVGLPFFSIILGGAFGLHYFQQVRFDFRRIRQQDDNLHNLRSDLSSSGVNLRENVTIDSVLKEVFSIDTDNWENIRGPRETEDNTEYFQINAPVLPELDIENHPEPDETASIRAERGSPTPSCVTVDHIPDPPGRHYQPSQTLGSEFSDSSQLPASASDIADDTPLDPAAATTLNSELLAHLLDLGFDELTCNIALKRTFNAGVEEAVNWIIDHSNPSDFGSESSQSDEEEGDQEDVEMGGVASAVTAGGAAITDNALMKAIMTAQKNSRTHKMVLVANMGLKMGTGKLAAQVGHATLAVYRQAMTTEAGQSAVEAWMHHGQVKIVVKGNSTEELMDLYKAGKDSGCFCYLVQDAGYTQIPPGSRTVLGVFGEKEKVDAVTGKLRLL